MTGTTATPHAPPSAWTLTAVLRLQEDGPEVERETVTDADLADLRGELWLAGCLRKGRPEVPLADMSFRMLPVFKASGGPKCGGFVLQGEVPGGEPVRRTCTIHSLTDVAARGAQRLLAAGLLKDLETYFYELRAEHKPADERPAGGMPTFTMVARTKPLSYLTTPLPPLLKNARTEGAEDRDHYPVLFTEAALAKAERFARKGAGREKAVETGGVLLGPLCACPETDEFFAVVCDVLEVQDAEEKKFSLNYTGRTWERLQAVLRTVQAQPATAAYRLLGQCHGHNFKPAGEPCADCALVKECSKTSVFVSLDDRLWSRAVFAGQPWQLCHIFGLNVRNEGVQRLYGLNDGRLEERGYYVIPEFRA